MRSKQEGTCDTLPCEHLINTWTIHWHPPAGSRISPLGTLTTWALGSSPFSDIGITQVFFLPFNGPCDKCRPLIPNWFWCKSLSNCSLLGFFFMPTLSIFRISAVPSSCTAVLAMSMSLCGIYSGLRLVSLFLQHIRIHQYLRHWHHFASDWYHLWTRQLDCHYDHCPSLCKGITATILEIWLVLLQFLWAMQFSILIMFGLKLDSKTDWRDWSSGCSVLRWFEHKNFMQCIVILLLRALIKWCISGHTFRLMKWNGFRSTMPSGWNGFYFVQWPALDTLTMMDGWKTCDFDACVIDTGSVIVNIQFPTWKVLCEWIQQLFWCPLHLFHLGDSQWCLFWRCVFDSGIYI